MYGRTRSYDAIHAQGAGTRLLQQRGSSPSSAPYTPQKKSVDVRQCKHSDGSNARGSSNDVDSDGRSMGM